MIIHGDCLEALKQLPGNSVDAVVTDPPYGLSFMGKKWDYDVPSVEIWHEVLRVLKPGGHLLSFGGTRTYHRMAVNIEDAGFEIRDQIQWLYGSGFPKSHNLKGDFEGWGTALKPANEPICLARKSLEKKLTVAKNVQKWGTGALNIDAGRIEASDAPDVPNFSSNAKSRHVGILNGGKVSADEPRTTSASQQGRWPANILFDEEAAKLLDEQSGQLKSGKPGSRKKEWAGYATGLKTLEKESGFGDSGGASRFFYVAKASKSERGKENTHPTVKPVKLMEYLIKLVTPPTGIVLDPFCGSGTTGVAATRLGFGFIGIEREAEYVEIARKRMGGAA